MGRYGNERTAFAIDNFLNELPSLILKNRIASMELAARHEEAKAARAHDFNLLEEKENMAMRQIYYESQRDDLHTSLDLIDQKIVANESIVDERKLNVESLIKDLPGFNTVEYTGNPEDTLTVHAGELSKQQEVVLKALYEDKKEKEFLLEQVEAEADYYGEAQSNLVFLEHQGKQVPSNYAPDGNDIKNQADMKAYFDSVLSIQYDNEGSIIEGTGNNQFDSKDPNHSYYRQVFIDTFGPTVEAQEKQYSDITKAKQTQIAAELELVQVKSGVNDQYRNAVAKLAGKIYNTVKNDDGELVPDPDDPIKKAEGLNQAGYAAYNSTSKQLQALGVAPGKVDEYIQRVIHSLSADQDSIELFMDYYTSLKGSDRSIYDAVLSGYGLQGEFNLIASKYADIIKLTRQPIALPSGTKPKPISEEDESLMQSIMEAE